MAGIACAQPALLAKLVTEATPDVTVGDVKNTVKEIVDETLEKYQEK